MICFCHFFRASVCFWKEEPRESIFFVFHSWKILLVYFLCNKSNNSILNILFCLNYRICTEIYTLLRRFMAFLHHDQFLIRVAHRIRMIVVVDWKWTLLTILEPIESLDIFVTISHAWKIQRWFRRGRAEARTQFSPCRIQLGSIGVHASGPAPCRCSRHRALVVHGARTGGARVHERGAHSRLLCPPPTWIQSIIHEPTIFMTEGD